ncbi:hypothetical protein SJI19_19365 [Acerihabitans sp. TG2]|uniref:hypothetical protein n=1 Tax=Acerihabitans sp. TG2 TaxID=3096008 RepID=UPI002B2365AC|nr:hypothetical protein [Acerihabitans sp. TG2]MEA9392667.1 hypothetical protein [Acerihabitans sp. TG2]
MHKLTQIVLDNGERALYLDGYYLGSEDCNGEKMSLSEMAVSLMKVPGFCLQDILHPCPKQGDWSWNDVSTEVFPPAVHCDSSRSMTVAALMARLSVYPDDALCCGTFWLEEDFLGVDASLTPDEIHLAMEIADDNHDANVGYNWDYLRNAIEQAKQ